MAQQWLGKVQVTLKPVVLDPQGSAILGGLHNLGFTQVSQVRAGKYIEISLEAANQEAASLQIQRMCETLLANPVIEDFRFTLEQSPPPV